MFATDVATDCGKLVLLVAVAEVIQAIEPNRLARWHDFVVNAGAVVVIAAVTYVIGVGFMVPAGERIVRT